MDSFVKREKNQMTAKEFVSMNEITELDFLTFREKHKSVTIGKNEIMLGTKSVKEYQPKDFELELTNVWSFPNRGKWATHQSNYRGNWAPQISRNLIIRYSKPKETVLDQMCGSGTTLIECKLLDRNGVGVDINSNAVMVTRNLLNFDYKRLDYANNSFQKTYVGDARNLDLIDNDSIDLIATHPPYANIISYSSKKDKVVGDISCSRSLKSYLSSIKKIAEESYRVLKPNRFCAILIGDTRKHRHHVPIAFRVMECFLGAGFILREDIIKCQWKTKQTRERWIGLANSTADNWIDLDKTSRKGFYTDFYLLAHEHLFVFRKPYETEKVSNYLLSMNNSM